MRNYTFIIPALFCFAALTIGSWANVFPSDLSASGVAPNISLSYRLNEAADSVSVEVLDIDTLVVVRTLTGTTSQGLNTVIWDGKDTGGNIYPKSQFKFRVTALQTTGHTAYDQIAVSSARFGTLVGDGVNPNRPDLDVNREPSSPSYGWILVQRSNIGPATNDGYGVFRADASFVRFDNFGNTTYVDPLPGPVDTMFDAASVNSPRRIVFAPDESATEGAGIFYTADYSDGDENIFRLNLDTGAVVRSYAPADRDDGTAPGSTIGGNPAADCLGNAYSVQVIGTGAARVIYVLDEDIENGVEETLVRLNIGTAELFNGILGTEVPVSVNYGTWQEADDLGGTFTPGGFNFGWDFHVLSDGTSLIGGNTDGANVALFRLNNFQAGAPTKNFAGTTPVWESADDPNSAAMEADSLYGLAVDENRGVVYAYMRDDATENGNVYELNLTTGAIANAGNPVITVLDGGTAMSDRGSVAVDPVGNICVFNSADGFLRIFSPPSGPNSSSTTSGAFSFSYVTRADNNWILYE